jgi:hypothetical protein
MITVAVLDRVLCLMEELTAEKKQELSDFFGDLASGLMTPDLVRFLFARRDNENPRFLVRAMAEKSPERLIGLFFACDLLSPKEEDIGFILTLVGILVGSTNNHFFDDWLLKQAPNCTFFNPGHLCLSQFVLPITAIQPILIPTLLPFCAVLGTKSFDNRFLISRYALPIYRKLGKDIPSQYIEYAFAHFLR